jgi:S-formylglutathione hydrolase FrmB
MRSAWLVSGFLFSCLGIGCGNSDVAEPAVDASVEASTSDGSSCTFLPQGLEIYSNIPTSVVGTPREAEVRLNIDFCEALTLELTSSNPTVATVPTSATIAYRSANQSFEITPVGVGTTTITAHVVRNGMPFDATLEFAVTADAIPACAGSATGNIAPGASIAVTGAVSLAGASISIPTGATRDDHYHVDAFDTTIGCGTDQIPEGYRALGPAVTFGPSTWRTYREIALELPINLALLPENAGLQHVEIAYSSTTAQTPRVVPFATHVYNSDKSLLRFQTPRLGTFQAVVRDTAGQTRTRHFTFRGMTGFSMGAMGAAQIASHHPERFDFSAPLGGPTDFAYALRYFRDYNFGGFCTEEERILDATSCESGASESRTPVNDQLYQHRQDFEHWYYADGREGQGGTFDRNAWIKIFRDLSRMYGNPNSDRSADNSEPNLLPPGVPASFLDQDNATRCSSPIVIPPHNSEDPASGFFDDEYNPDGAYPVITFCDGSEVVVDGRRDVGIWDPGGWNDIPVETFLAVDINGNGRRDPGEPLPRNLHEPYEDVGLDGVASVDEEGYDAVTNPDPAGDDYDFQFNPTGTERNWHRDGDPCIAGAVGVAEPFADFGLDGVLGTAQLSEGGYDFGEADGCLTLAQGTARMHASDARINTERMSDSALQRLDFWGDSGIRDLLNSTPSMSNFMGTLSGRGRTLRIVNGHDYLGYRDPVAGTDFDFTSIDYRALGGSVFVRYGNPDASEAELVQGDGGHVGTAWQLISRLQSAMAWMSAHWPDGDRSRARRPERVCREGDDNCPNPNQLVFDFTSSAGRTGPAAMILPPGYFDEENAAKSYPVIYLLHGYGMEPGGLVDTALLFWSFMTANNVPEFARLQRVIFVFPDGRCRGEECITGTFYTDGPESRPESPQMETWLLELMDYVDTNYRTRAEEDFEEQL